MFINKQSNHVIKTEKAALNLVQLVFFYVIKKVSEMDYQSESAVLPIEQPAEIKPPEDLGELVDLYRARVNPEDSHRIERFLYRSGGKWYRNTDDYSTLVVLTKEEIAGMKKEGKFLLGPVSTGPDGTKEYGLCI